MPRRPRHLLLNTLTTLSTLLVITTLTLWLRSQTASDQLTYRRPDGARHLRTATDHLVLGFDLSDWSHQPPDYYGLHYERTEPQETLQAEIDVYSLSIGPRDTFQNWNHHGDFAWIRWRSASRQSSIARLILPFWSLALLTALLPLTRLLLRLRPRRAAATTLCPTCNYDCRATPTRCPECGTLLP